MPTLLLGAVLFACDVPAGSTSTGGRETPIRPEARATSLARDPASGLAFVAVRGLPPEGQRTLKLIRAGGPFPYRKDGVTFGNREGVLPQRPRGGYREYTVPTPGEGNRGARRIVCAALNPADRECYYTADHYATFRRIRP
ncbi:ribonuclease T1 [Deinococcus hopiensis KR-140]|uniref:Ribonuclease T1 n=1 Tax=Deinococcus hopiensis KR-140 TaxID=695939 RepID=A0A1W1VEJ3_9DEIO|nr:ribonuclease T1 [Deinococcus hopiensis KR-140]